jgi:drug/metabolite transporter (DMT)-like permease
MSARSDVPRVNTVPSTRARTVLAYTGCALIWGTTWFAIRVCIGPGGYPTFASAAIRFALAAGILGATAAMGLIGRGPTSRRQWSWVAAGGVVCGLAYGLVYAGEAHISGGVAAVIFGTLPPITAVSTTVAGFERPRPAFVVGSVVALAGIAVLYADRMGASASQATGVALVFASVFLTAIYNLILKRHASGTNPLATNIPFLGAAAVTLAVFALALERRAPPWPPPVAPTLALFYLVLFGSIAAFSLYFYLLRHMSLTAVSTLLFVEPVLALVIDAAWEREIRLGLRAYAGAALTLVGLAITLAPRRGRAGS